MRRKKIIGSISAILVLLLGLSACSPAATTVESQATVTEAQTEETKAASESTSETSSDASSSATVDTDDAEFGADVIVIGAGGAGLSAAIEAADAGASVIVIEKMPNIGGNTLRSEGGLNAAESKPQEAAGIEDSVATMVEDTLKGGKNINNPELVQFLAEQSNDAIDWLTGLGMDVTEVVQGAGATNKRMHRSQGGAKVGSVLIPVLEKNIEERDITVLLNTKATKLIIEDKQVVGLEGVDKDGETLWFKANAIVIATGGFGANEDLFTKYRSDLAGFKTTNHPGASGDGVVMAEEVGADLVDMEQIQTNPTVEVTSTTVISESVRGNGAILVNQEGNRFISEMETRDVLSSAILKETDKVAYLIFDEGVFSSMKVLQENFDMGIITRADSIEELAEANKIDPSNLEATIAKWNEIVESKNDTEFNRSTGLDNNMTKAPYYSIKVSPAVHYTMGGIRINTNTEVLDTEGQAIAGLFAAGEVTGGVHGGNRLGGNAVADIIVFGRQAGISSAAFASTLDAITKNAPVQIEEVATPQTQGDFVDGVYQGTGKGNYGSIEVEVEVKDKNIVRVTVLSHEETEALFKPVETELVNKIIKTQTLDVDAISGATKASDGIIEAIRDALK